MKKLFEKLITFLSVLMGLAIVVTYLLLALGGSGVPVWKWFEQVDFTPMDMDVKHYQIPMPDEYWDDLYERTGVKKWQK